MALLFQGLKPQGLKGFTFVRTNLLFSKDFAYTVIVETSSSSPKKCQDIDPVKENFSAQVSEKAIAPQIVSCPGLISYQDALKLQMELHRKRVADLIPDTFLFLEHEPVITRGRGLQYRPQNQPISLEEISRQMAMGISEISGIPVIDTERGGGLTYHGPGQLVIYPICKLGPSGQWINQQDLGWFLRKLERVVVQWLNSAFEDTLFAFVKKDESGVWVRKSETGQNLKNSKGPFLRNLPEGVLSRAECESAIASIILGEVSVGRENLKRGFYLGRGHEKNYHEIEQSEAVGLPVYKIASLGVAVRKWVTFHGIAINLTNDLTPFQTFSPCGYSSKVMTRLADWI